MEIGDPLSFAGNVLAFLAASGKTYYDLVVNPKRFRQELESLNDLEAAKRKRDRSDRSMAAAFVLLAVSYALMILATVRVR